jgi:hypothetical protein
MAKKLDPKAKAKREKVIAAAAGVVLLGVLAFAVPMTMKQLKAQNATPAAAAATAPATTTTPTVSSELASATGPSVSLGQLGSFSRFDSKDPFTQQVDPKDLGGSADSGGGSGSREAGSVAPRPSGSSGSTASPPPPRVPAPLPTSAVITVNGGPPQRITVGQDFPLPPFDPLFHLVALTRKAAKISISGGSLDDGKATVALRKGRPLTLMNTADGTRYELRLLWLGTGVPPASILPPAPATGSGSSAATTTTTTTTAP